MHHITFLDASTMGEIDLDPLARFGEFETYDMTLAGQITSRLGKTTIAITNKVIIDAEVINQAPELELICVAATGTNCVELEAARAAGVTVCNVAGYSTASVTQHTIGLLINLATGMHRYAHEARQWPDSPIFTRLDYPMTDLAGKTLGIIGLGSIGQSVATAAQSLGMKVVALARGGAQGGAIERWERERFFSETDAISLHCPLTPETEGIINRDTLAMMKNSAWLINTGRGPLVVEQDLARALQEGGIAGAGLDVLCEEPPAPGHVLLDPSFTNLMVTPHTAWASAESRTRLLEGICGNIESYLAGAPSNVVN